MMKADLHIHSTVSDGSLTMEEIADRAVAKGLDAIGITDHDTVAHFDRLPQREGLQVIPGTEISAYDRGLRCKVHILGYRIQNPECLERYVEPIRRARHKNCLRQMSILEKAGYRLPPEEIQKADGAYIYKQHIMDYLCRTGQVPDMFGEFYRKVFKNGGICDFDIAYMDAVCAIHALKEAGGLAVLAHSGQQQNFELIPVLVREGLDGLEYDHPSNSDADKAIIQGYAKKYRLFLTGGSDFHGRFERDSADLGTHLSPESGIQTLFGQASGWEMDAKAM